MLLPRSVSQAALLNGLNKVATTALNRRRQPFSAGLFRQTAKTETTHIPTMNSNKYGPVQEAALCHYRLKTTR